MSDDRTGPAPTLSPLTLPRSRALTDALTTPGNPPSAAAVATARRLVVHELEEASRRTLPNTACLRVRAFDLVRSDLEPGAPGGTPEQSGRERAASDRSAFRWTSRTARRRVGLAALRAWVAQPGLAPADAVALVVADAAGPDGPGPRGPGSCADWLASLSAPARAMVQAEATTWATAVWTALEWDRLRPAPVVGAPDRWWDWHGPLRVALQGRVDVRIPGPGGAHLLVLGGFPSAASRRALCFSALVDALRSEGADAPARVVAWWPDCGKAWVAAITGDELRACAAQVGRVVRRAMGTGAAAEIGSAA